MTRMEQLKVRRRMQQRIRATVEERRLALALAPAPAVLAAESEPDATTESAP
jgi:hypothetical protein